MLPLRSWRIHKASQPWQVSTEWMGLAPRATLIQGIDGNFFGTTSASEPNVYGTAFEISAAGTITVLHGFNLTDGAAPLVPLVQGVDGNFYGTTYEGANGYGTVFRVTPTGEFTTLHVFCSEPNCSDGENPWGGWYKLQMEISTEHLPEVELITPHDI